MGVSLPALQIAARFERAQPAFQSKIRTFARKRYRSLPSVDACEIEQELLEVLWLCCLSYDPDQGAKFSTFFWTSAERRFLDLHKAASRQKRAGDYERVWIEAEGFRDVVHEMKSVEGSAEEEALARIHVREIFRSSDQAQVAF
jgi:DNA-directed RNA polymerase specialized sigma24 family protein